MVCAHKKLEKPLAVSFFVVTLHFVWHLPDDRTVTTTYYITNRHINPIRGNKRAKGKLNK